MTRIALAFLLLMVAQMTPVVAAESDKTCNALFVHSAQNVSLTGTTLTMKGASPSVIFFCDRPIRVAGHLSIAEFIRSVTQGEDSFAADPPNAVVSIASGDKVTDVVVVLTSRPAVQGDQLTYTDIRIIDGEASDAVGPGSVFIDIIGRPLSPGSIAGVHRRHQRRAMRRCAAGVTCW